MLGFACSGQDCISKACVGFGDLLAQMLSNMSNFKEFYSKTGPIFFEVEHNF